MKKYKVVAFGGHDGLLFEELLVKFSGGYQLPLKVKQGEYVPLEILDPLDVKKSIMVGSLGRYLKGGQVIEETNESVKVEVVQKPSKISKPNKVSETKPETVVEEQISEAKSATVPVQVPAPAAVSNPEEMLSSISQVKVEDDFYKLGFFMKVKFIENCSDKALLQKLLTKTTGSHQLQTNIQLKLATLR